MLTLNLASIQKGLFLNKHFDRVRIKKFIVKKSCIGIMDINWIAKENGLLSEDISWNDNTVPLSDCGVRYEWIQNFLQGIQNYIDKSWEFYDSHSKAYEYLNFSDLIREPIEPKIPRDEDITPEFIVPNFIKPLTIKSKSPLYARVPSEFRGKPDVFVSHSWNQILPITINLIVSYRMYGMVDPRYNEGPLHGKPRYGENPYLWIDVISYNQHKVESIADDMKAIIRFIGNLALPIPTYNRMFKTPFSRLWCLWELLCAYETKSEILLCDTAMARADVGKGFELFQKSFSSVSNASTTLEKDKVEILNAIISTFGSIDAADKYIRQLIDKFLPKPFSKRHGESSSF
jgi:hypothetical protein